MQAKGPKDKTGHVDLPMIATIAKRPFLSSLSWSFWNSASPSGLNASPNLLREQDSLSEPPRMVQVVQHPSAI